jgi:tetratricopeptide (TPR) repeat protein
MLRFLFKPQVSNFFLKSREPLKKFFSGSSNNNHVALNLVMWEKMTRTERMNVALANSDPKIAEIAYYKGLGLKKLGLDFSNEAISSFEKSMELDETYKAISEREIANIYKDLGLPEKAFNFMKKAFNDMVENSENFNKAKEKLSSDEDSIDLDSDLSRVRILPR